MNGRRVRGVLAVLLVSGVVSCGQPAPSNVLLVTMDTTRQDVLSVYGGEAQTPALGRLAGDGIVFSNAFSVAFGTTPSHASLLTSSHASSHGVFDNKTVLDARYVTLAEVFDQAGYTTGAFVSAAPVSRRLGLDQGFRHYDDVFGPQRNERSADVTVDRFLQWLADVQQASAPRPFFAWLHFYDPHQPYASPAEPAGRPVAVFETPEGKPRYVAHEDLAGLAFDELRRLERVGQGRYRAEVEFLDAQLGRLFDTLRASGLFDATLIAVVADHGENLRLERGAGLLFDHAGIHADVSRIPLILKLPQARHAGSRHDVLLGSPDIAATMLDLLDLPVPRSWAGKSFMTRLAAPVSDPRPYLILEGAHGHEIGVRTRRFLYREVPERFRRREDVLAYQGYHLGRPFELYDLQTDPEEMHPVDRPEAVRELRGLVQAFRESVRKGEAGKTLTSPEHLDALRALGYIR